MHDEAGIIFLLVFMKIPVAFSLWLIYKAVRAEPDPLDGGEGWDWRGQPEPGSPLPLSGKNPWSAPEQAQKKERTKERSVTAVASKL